MPQPSPPPQQVTERDGGSVMEGESRVSHPDSSRFHSSTSKCLKRQRSSLLEYGALDGLTMEDKKKSCGSSLMFWKCRGNCDRIMSAIWFQVKMAFRPVQTMQQWRLLFSQSISLYILSLPLVFLSIVDQPHQLYAHTYAHLHTHTQTHYAAHLAQRTGHCSHSVYDSVLQVRALACWQSLKFSFVFPPQVPFSLQPTQ